MGEKTKVGVKTSRRIGASLLPALDLPPWAPASSSCSMKLTKRLTRGLRWVLRDLRAIVKEGEKDQERDFYERAGLPIGYEAFRIVK